jgi:HprK-related kinase A
VTALVRDLDAAEFEDRLARGIGIRLGPFHARVRVREASIVEPLQTLYAEYPLLPEESVFSFHVRLDALRHWRPWGEKQVRFTIDGIQPHEDMPAAHALAVLEWGINLVVAMRSHHYLMLHSAVVANESGALLLPAAPGAGKSTLCAALALSGWRLFSDEFGLLRPGTLEMVPAPRPMALKDASIDVIRRFSGEAVLGPEIPGTRKGTVAHVRPPGASIADSDRTATARWIVYPRWQEGAECRLQEIPRGESFMLLATNAFNYEVLGEAAFDTVRELIDTTRSYRLVYSDLGEALATIDGIMPPHRQ